MTVCYKEKFGQGARFRPGNIANMLRQITGTMGPWSEQRHTMPRRAPANNAATAQTNGTGHAREFRSSSMSGGWTHSGYTGNLLKSTPGMALLSGAHTEGLNFRFLTIFILYDFTDKQKSYFLSKSNSHIQVVRSQPLL